MSQNGAFMSDRAFYADKPLRPNINDRVAASFRAPTRIADNFLAGPERQLLRQFCRLMPARIMPDHLTAIGIVGAVITALGYLASNYNPIFFFLASFGLVVNWFGDSLDGSLARYRKIERPRLLVFTWLPDWQGDETESVVRIELEEANGLTTVRLTHSGLVSEASRQSHKGWPQILTWLRDYSEISRSE